MMIMTVARLSRLHMVPYHIAEIVLSLEKCPLIGKQPVLNHNNTTMLSSRFLANGLFIIENVKFHCVGANQPLAKIPVLSS